MEWLILVIMCTILWPVICGIIAKNKNRSVVGWVMAGIFFGVFAVIVLAVLQKSETKSDW